MTRKEKLTSYLALGTAVLVMVVTFSAAINREHSCPEATPGYEAQTAICRAVNG